MMRIICIWSLLSLALSMHGQRQDGVYSVWNAEPGFGLFIGINKLKNGALTDELLGYQDRSMYIQAFFGTIYATKNWGIEAYLQFSLPIDDRQKLSKVQQNLYDLYPEQFYILNSNLSSHYTESGIVRGLFGFSRRFEHNDFYTTPKVYIGVTSFDNEERFVELKEKNSNTYLEYYLKPNRATTDCFTVATGVSEAYRLSRRFLIRADFLYSYFKSKLTYTESWENLYTRETTVTYYSYNKGIHAISFGLGIAFEVRWKKIKEVKE